MERILGGSGINWAWYVGFFDHGDGSVTVTMHDRVHRFDGSRHPQITGPGGYAFKELDGRVAVALQVDGQEKTIRNPKYVFGFGNI